MPIPNDGKVLDDPKQYRSMFSAVDGETMKVAWQIIVDGNLDNVDADYQGKYAFSTCYNSEEGVTLAEMMAKEQDWVVIFNLKRIEEAVKAGKAEMINGVPVARRPQGLALHALRPGSEQPARHQHGAGRHPRRRQRQAVADRDGAWTCASSTTSSTTRSSRATWSSPSRSSGSGRCTPPMTARATPIPRCSSTARSASGTSTWPSGPTGARRSTRSSRSWTCTTSPATTTPPWARPRRRTASG